MFAFAISFFLYPSLLHFQRAMKTRRRRDNRETLFGCPKYPATTRYGNSWTAERLRRCRGIFRENLRTAEAAKEAREGVRMAFTDERTS
jgi:hypothetical protein